MYSGTMNITVPFFALAGLTIVYNKLLFVIEQLKEQNTWEVINIITINCTNGADQTIQLMARHEIPLTISSSFENLSYPEAPEIILSDGFNVDLVNVNLSKQRILLLNSETEFNRMRPHLTGRLLIILLNSQNAFCRNPLFNEEWVSPDNPLCLSIAHRNTNTRRISVFLTQNTYGYAEKQESGNYFLVGLKGLYLYEMEKYLNAKLSFVLPEIHFANNSTLQNWRIPNRGIFMGKVNDTLTINATA